MSSHLAFAVDEKRVLSPSSPVLLAPRPQISHPDVTSWYRISSWEAGMRCLNMRSLLERILEGPMTEGEGERASECLVGGGDFWQY